MECGGRPSTVRTAATSACPITWPPNTRCQPTCGLLPRNKSTSSRSRSRRLSRSWTAVGAEDMNRAFDAAAANDAGGRREVKARGRFRRHTAALKIFGRQIACRPFRTSDAGDRYQTKKYASAMIAAIATPNQIMGWVILSCDWDWVVMDLPFPPRSEEHTSE